MTDDDLDTPMRMAAFEHVRRLGEVHDHLTADELKPGFVFEGERIPLVNPRRGIFKPRQMRYLLSIKTVYPRPGARVWYDDQRDVHRQIFEGDETVDYAFMRQNPEAADNRWLREAFENKIPVIYFLGIAPGRYQAVLPAFISGWDADALKAGVAFGMPEQDAFAPPENALERRYALRAVQQRLHQASFREAVIAAYDGRFFWAPLLRQRESASPSRRPGRPALEHCPDACVGQGPSFARSASRSTTSRKAGRVPGSFTSRRRGIPAARIMASNNRPHRPHRPRTRPKAMEPTHTRKTTGGRLESLRTVGEMISAWKPARPSAPNL